MNEKNRRDTGRKWLIWVAVALLIAGLAAEVILKYETAVRTVTDSRASNEENVMRAWRKTLTLIGDETLTLYIVPIYSLKLMSILPYLTRGGGTVTLQDLLWYDVRWLPYLILFLLPVLYIRFKKKFLLILPGAVSLLQAVQIICVMATVDSVQVNCSYYHAIPFILEAALLFMMCGALGKDGKGWKTGLGIVAVVLAVLSPLVSALLFDLPSMLRSAARFAQNETDYVYPWASQLRRQAANFPYSYACSFWPIYKTFAFLIYALILFFGVPKRAGAERADKLL